MSQPQITEEGLENLMADVKYVMPEFTLSIKDLKNPKADLFVCYFEAVLREFGIDTNDVMHNIWEAQRELIEHCELIPLVKLCMAVKKLYPQKLGHLANLSLEAFLEPKPSDVVYIVVMACFHKFAADRLASFFNMEGIVKLKEEKNELKLLQVKVEELKELAVKRIVERSQQVHRKQELQEKLSKLKEELKVLQEQREESKKALEEVRQDVEEKAKKHNKLGHLLSQHKAQWEQLSSEVVHSPQALKDELELLARRKEQMEAEYEALKVKKKENRCQLKLQQDLLELISVCRAKQENLLTLIKQMEMSQQKCAMQARDTSEHITELKLVQAELAMRKKKLQEIKELCGTVSAQLKSLKEENSKQIELARTAYEEEYQRNLDLVKEYNSVQEEKERMRLRIARTQADIQAALQDYNNNKEALLNKIAQFFEDGEKIVESLVDVSDNEC